MIFLWSTDIVNDTCQSHEFDQVGTKLSCYPWVWTIIIWTVSCRHSSQSSTAVARNTWYTARTYQLSYFSMKSRAREWKTCSRCTSYPILSKIPSRHWYRKVVHRKLRDDLHHPASIIALTTKSFEHKIVSIQTDDLKTYSLHFHYIIRCDFKSFQVTLRNLKSQNFELTLLKKKTPQKSPWRKKYHNLTWYIYIYIYYIPNMMSYSTKLLFTRNGVLTERVRIRSHAGYLFYERELALEKLKSMKRSKYCDQYPIPRWDYNHCMILLYSRSVDRISSSIPRRIYKTDFVRRPSLLKIKTKNVQRYPYIIISLKEIRSGYSYTDHIRRVFEIFKVTYFRILHNIT